MLLTATGSLGSMSSTEATPIGDWISPETVGCKHWKQSRYEKKSKSKIMSVAMGGGQNY